MLTLIYFVCVLVLVIEVGNTDYQEDSLTLSILNYILYRLIPLFVGIITAFAILETLGIFYCQ